LRLTPILELRELFPASVWEGLVASLRSIAVEVPRHRCQNAIEKLRRAGLLDFSHRTASVGENVLIPVTEGTSDEALQIALSGVEMRLVSAELRPRERRHGNLRDLLSQRIDSSLLGVAPRSYDVIGSVAVVQIGKGLEPHVQEVAESIARLNKNVETVLVKRGPISTRYRVGEFDVVAGSGNTVTRYRENGCVFELDVKRVFFSPRLSGERLRVARQVRSGETVADMFAGVGPYSILIGKMRRAKLVYASELNPEAFHYLKRNVALNKVDDVVHQYLGDAREVFSSKPGSMDRVVMNLPYGAMDYLDAALALLGRDGVIHFYGVGRGDEAVDVVSRAFETRCRELRRGVSIYLSKRLKEVAPRTWTVAVDAVIE